MKNYYLKSVILGLMGLTLYVSPSQNLLYDGDFSVTTEIVPFDGPSPPINQWAFWVNYYGNGSEANPTVVDGVCNFQIINPGNDTWEVQLAQWGFPLIQGHKYQLSFDVKADTGRPFGVYLGEDGGNWTDLIGYDRYWYYATTEWQTISIDFEASAVFELHKLSFELGGDATTTYFDNIMLQDTGTTDPNKIVIAGTFQDELGCYGDWNPDCDATELTLNSSTGLYTGVFQIPEGNHRYKVTVGGGWDINYGENGLFRGPDIYLCVPSGSEDITFTYDPSTHVVVTTPIASGFSPECPLLVVLVGSFQDELGCYGDWVPECTNTALIYNSSSGLFEGDFNIPTGCYEYRVVLDTYWLNNFGRDGIHEGPNYSISIPVNPEVNHFTYDPFSHVVSSTPYNVPTNEVTKVSLIGNLQDEVGCDYDYSYECDNPALQFNSNSGAWEGSFTLPAGCYTYQVKETFGCNDVIIYGDNGIQWGNEIQLYVPENVEMTFIYDPQTHIISSSPYSGASQAVLKVSLMGNLQDELGCSYDYDSGCEYPALELNSNTGLWEGSFTLPTGCYMYQVKESTNCDITYYGENGYPWGNSIQLYVPLDAEITFSYDPQTHIMSSTPYSGAPQEVTKVSLIGTLQDELGCTNEYDYGCDLPALSKNDSSGAWEGSFVLPAGCYSYRVKETFGCNNETYYGENGIAWGNVIDIYVPSDSEITFSYDPQTHIISSSPYSGAPQELTKVSLQGTLQDELGCPNDNQYDCNNPELVFNSGSGTWEGSFTLPTGCYTYIVKETSGCNTINFYGEDGVQWGNEIQLYVPEESEITFSYDPQTHIISSSPYSGAPQEVTKVSLQGNLQNELGCNYDYDYECNNPELVFNSGSGTWEGGFTLPAGCYSYIVKETFGCNTINFYGADGVQWGNEIQLYVPEESEITFSYDPLTHIMTTTPYGSAPEEVTMVSLIGTLQDELGCNYDYDYECSNPALQLNSNSGLWEGSFTLLSGCYIYRVKETFGCNNVTFYGEDGIPWGNEIQLSVTEESEITFSYDPQTHIISSTPFQDASSISLLGTMQDELGCAYDYDYECSNPALQFNSNSGLWEGSFELPAGCYNYVVKQTVGCDNVIFYGENGLEWGEAIQLYVPEDGEISFSYDSQTHFMSSTPYSGPPQEATMVTLIGTLQDELGCNYDYDYECDHSSLMFNPGSGAWEGNFMLPAGCYIFRIQQTDICDNVSTYGENGIEWGEVIQLYVLEDAEIMFSYDPQTHIISSTPYSGAPQEVTKVSLLGSLQDELGCEYDNDYECDQSSLLFNPGSGAWEGSFVLPAGCYIYRVKETFGCYNEILYGENGTEWGEFIQLYVPEDSMMMFSYDPQTHIMSSSPYSGAPQEVTLVSLIGTLQDELGCDQDFDYECGHPALQFNPGSGAWEGSFVLPAGCYIYRVKETFGCYDQTLYGENGIEWGEVIQLYVPEDVEIAFSYNTQTHIMSSTPYSGAPQEVTIVSLIGTLQNELGCDYDYDYECGHPALQFNPSSGAWEGSVQLPAGCYSYRVKETFGCYNETLYGENGAEWGNDIQLYVPEDGEMTFSYNPQTHIMSSSPYSGAPQEVTHVSLMGSLQDELGCAQDYDYECDNPTLQFNSSLGTWEGSFILPAGCFTYIVKETFGCNVTLFGEYGIPWGGEIQLFVPVESEITFSYDTQTHIVSTTPYTDISTLNQCPDTIYVNNTPGSCGAIVDYPEFVATANCGGDILSIKQTEGLPSGTMFPVGITTNSFLFTKTTGEEKTCSFDVVVFDTESPVISDINKVHEPLWPPNHKMVPVFLDYNVTDNCGAANIELYIASNEPENGLGDGDTAPDWEILDEHHVMLRAERSGKGNGRQYTITIRAIDASGNYMEYDVFVKVASDNSKLIDGWMDSESRSNEFSLYPNPANDVIHIKGPKSSSSYSYIIYDMLGAIKKEGIMRNDQIEIEALSNGLYMLKLETDKGTIYKKFITN